MPEVKVSFPKGDHLDRYGQYTIKYGHREQEFDTEKLSKKLAMMYVSKRTEKFTVLDVCGSKETKYKCLNRHIQIPIIVPHDLLRHKRARENPRVNGIDSTLCSCRIGACRCEEKDIAICIHTIYYMDAQQIAAICSSVKQHRVLAVAHRYPSLQGSYFNGRHTWTTNAQCQLVVTTGNSSPRSHGDIRWLQEQSARVSVGGLSSTLVWSVKQDLLNTQVIEFELFDGQAPSEPTNPILARNTITGKMERVTSLVIGNTVTPLFQEEVPSLLHLPSIDRYGIQPIGSKVNSSVVSFLAAKVGEMITKDKTIPHALHAKIAVDTVSHIVQISLHSNKELCSRIDGAMVASSNLRLNLQPPGLLEQLRTGVMSALVPLVKDRLGGWAERLNFPSSVKENPLIRTVTRGLGLNWLSDNPSIDTSSCNPKRIVRERVLQPAAPLFADIDLPESNVHNEVDALSKRVLSPKPELDLAEMAKFREFVEHVTSIIRGSGRSITVPDIVTLVGNRSWNMESKRKRILAYEKVFKTGYNSKKYDVSRAFIKSETVGQGKPARIIMPATDERIASTLRISEAITVLLKKLSGQKLTIPRRRDKTPYDSVPYFASGQTADQNATMFNTAVASEYHHHFIMGDDYMQVSKGQLLEDDGSKWDKHYTEAIIKMVKQSYLKIFPREFHQEIKILMDGKINFNVSTVNGTFVSRVTMQRSGDNDTSCTNSYLNFLLHTYLDMHYSPPEWAGIAKKLGFVQKVIQREKPHMLEFLSQRYTHSVVVRQGLVGQEYFPRPKLGRTLCKLLYSTKQRDDNLKYAREVLQGMRSMTIHLPYFDSWHRHLGTDKGNDLIDPYKTQQVIRHGVSLGPIANEEEWIDVYGPSWRAAQGLYDDAIKEWVGERGEVQIVLNDPVLRSLYLADTTEPEPAGPAGVG